MNREEIYSQFEELDKKASLGGGVAKIEKQHAAGRMTARERIDMLLDKGTFCETDKFVNHRCTRFGMEKKQIPGDGVVCGYGKSTADWCLSMPTTSPFTEVRSARLTQPRL